MAISNVVVRAAVGAWSSVKYRLTRGLDISEIIPEVPGGTIGAHVQTFIDSRPVKILAPLTDTHKMTGELNP